MEAWSFVLLFQAHVRFINYARTWSGRKTLSGCRASLIMWASMLVNSRTSQTIDYKLLAFWNGAQVTAVLDQRKRKYP